MGDIGSTALAYLFPPFSLTGGSSPGTLSPTHPTTITDPVYSFFPFHRLEASPRGPPFHCSNPLARPFPLFSWAGGSSPRTYFLMSALNYDCACAPTSPFLPSGGPALTRALAHCACAPLLVVYPALFLRVGGNGTASLLHAGRESWFIEMLTLFFLLCHHVR